MTAFDRVERRLPELMDELAWASVPDYFDDMLQRAATTRQRPAWSAMERWLPMGEIARPLPMHRIPWRPIAILAMIGLLLVATAVYTASPRRAPAPFGSAANGLMYFHRDDGVIYAADLAAGTTKAVIQGTEAYEYPLPSRDGRQILFDHLDGDVATIFVADADGSNPRPLPGEYAGWTWVDWSPDGREIAIVSTVAGVPALSTLQADGSGAATLPLGREVKLAFYLPDGRLALVAAEDPGRRCRPDDLMSVCALMISDADGTNVRPLLSAAEFSGLSLSPSPDGSSLLYVRWADGEAGRLHVVDIATGNDRVVRIDNQAPEENINQAEFSPDGSRILFDRFEASGDHWAVVPTTGGAAVNIGLEWPDRPDGTLPEAHFSPDGRSIVAFYPGLDGDDQLWLLDATGQGKDQQLTLPATYVPPWQRVAP